MSVLASGGTKRSYLKADARQAQILVVAKAVFARKGYHVATIAHICAAAKIGRGTLYQYFENKRAVLLSILEAVEERVRVVVTRRPRVGELKNLKTADPLDIVTFCRRRLREVLDAVFVDKATLRIVLREARGLDGAVDRVLASIERRMLGAIEEDVRAAQKAGVARGGDARLVAQYLLGGVEKVVLTALAADEPVDLDQITQLAVHIQLFGILIKKEQS